MTNDTINLIKLQNPDIDLATAVTDVLHDIDFVQESRLNLQIDVMDSVVTVSGVVLSRLMKWAVLQAIARVPEVKHVIDCLYSDTDIVYAVSQALSIDPITKKMYDIKVTSYRGQVTLGGKVIDADMIRATSQLASGVLVVREVINRLTLAETSLLDVKALAHKLSQS
jgi:osmotically-inducible protein OsmY